VKKLQSLQGAGRTAEWDVRIPLPGQEPPLPVRLLRRAQKCGSHRAGAEKAAAQSPQSRVAIAAGELDFTLST